MAAAALGTALAVPLATGSSAPAGAAVIGGARSISDAVRVAIPGNTVPGNPTSTYHVLGFNDFHGNLQATAGLTQYGKFAGGAAWLSQYIKDRRALYPAGTTATVMAGDNIGASPLISGLYNDEPSTVATNFMGLDFASVGNHEFDKGKSELLRQQAGGCGADACAAKPYAKPDGTTTNVFPGANFQYLSANVIDNATSNPLFPASGIKTFANGSGGTTKVGFIGLVLQATPTIVTPSGVAGLTFLNETKAANDAAAVLKAQGVNTIVMVIHQGGFQSGSAVLNGCAGNLAGSDIEGVIQGSSGNGGVPLDPAINLIISGHTHAEYRCTYTTGGVTRIVTSASAFGRVLTDASLTIDDVTGKPVDIDATNIIVENSTNVPGGGANPNLTKPSDPAVSAVVAQYAAQSAPLANSVIGKVSADITNTANALGEIPSGDLIADAQLLATQPAGKGGAQIAFMNPGGIRGGSSAGFLFNQISAGEQPGEITYAEAFNIQPFGNSLVVKTMTGAMIRSLLEQQFPGCGGQTTQRILQVSQGFSYDIAPSAGSCSAKIGQIRFNGSPIDPSATYRVTMNSFLATGGDGFTVFNQGTDALGGDVDIDALKAYFAASLPGAVPAPPVNRLTLAVAPVVPESPYGVLLPIGAGAVIALFAGAVVVRRRRSLGAS